MYGYVPFAFLLSTIICASVAAWLFVRNDPRRPGFAFGLFVLVMGFWSATHVGTLFSSTLTWQLRFTQLSYVSVVLTPITWLVFSLTYSDRRELLTRRRLAVLSIVPALTLAFVFTAHHHSLFYASIELGDANGRPFLLITPGPWHAINIVYSYALVAVGTGLLVRSALTNNRLYRRQSAVLIALALAPWIVNVAFHVGIRSIPGLDPTPLAFTIVAIPFAVVVLRTDLTSFVPVAHERVFRTLDDPVLVVGPNGRVLDANDSATSVLGDGAPLEGTPISEALPDELLEAGTVRQLSGSANACSIDVDGTTRRYLARSRDIDPGLESVSRGVIVSLTDVTVQLNQRDALARKNEVLETQTAKLETKNEQLERLASVVSHDLATPLATGESLLHLVRADVDDPDSELEQSLDDLDAVHRRLREFAEALPELARESTDVESPIECDLETVAESAWEVVDTGRVTLAVDSTRTINADPRRLQQAFENLFQNAVEHGSVELVADGDPDATSRQTEAGDRVAGPTARSSKAVTTVRVGSIDSDDAGCESDRSDSSTDSGRSETDSGGFYVEDDGPGVPDERREHLLEFGVSTGSGAGYGLAIVRTIIEAHGWSLEIVDSRDGGARFEVRGVD
ncbi:histidine kinase N-terminal 7TM domain-containing protein [Natrarchaeobius sp. A-rgal3]|uniref:sensor histidine kinase n=1 Tax=Natrarchaeobius versutus TaxID=1679078 RepID=UPI0035108EF7